MKARKKKKFCFTEKPKKFQSFDFPGSFGRGISISISNIEYQLYSFLKSSSYYQLEKVNMIFYLLPEKSSSKLVTKTVFCILFHSAIHCFSTFSLCFHVKSVIVGVVPTDKVLILHRETLPPKFSLCYEFDFGKVAWRTEFFNMEWAESSFCSQN